MGRDMSAVQHRTPSTQGRKKTEEELLGCLLWRLSETPQTWTCSSPSPRHGGPLNRLFLTDLKDFLSLFFFSAEFPCEGVRQLEVGARGLELFRGDSSSCLCGIVIFVHTSLLVAPSLEDGPRDAPWKLNLERTLLLFGYLFDLVAPVKVGVGVLDGSPASPQPRGE